MMLYTRIAIPLFLASPKAALGECYWSPCKNKAVTFCVSACNSGYACAKESRECGDKNWLLGYTSEQHMCCKGCSWWDVNCNWDVIKDYFEEANEHIKDAWSKLSEGVQDKLTTSQKFQTLTTTELISLDTELLSELKTVIGMLPEQLEAIKNKVANMTSTHLQHFLDNINITTLSEGVATLASSATPWAAEQVTMLKDKLASSEVWGPIGNWTSLNIGSLGSLLTRFDLDTIANFADSALAHATSISNLSVEKINGLTDKFASMITENFDAVLDGLNIDGIHAAMLSQCEIQCQSDEDLAWFTDPSSQIAIDALAAYAERVKAKVSAASLAYADSFCSGGAGDLEHARALYANLQAASVPCNGSASKDNMLRQTFEQWSNSQANLLIERLTNQTALGPLQSWSDENIASLCHQFAALSPSNIAEIAANQLISSAGDVVLVSTFGFLAPVAEYAISKAADRITPEQRESWAAKLKEGLGSIAAWGCEQVASLQTMVAGLKAEDLSALASEAIKGLKANAITAMSADQLSGFKAEQMLDMLKDVRQRIHGHLLEKLDSNQLVAAVCGILTYPSGNESQCPPVIVDLSMSIPSINLPSMQVLIDHFVDFVPDLNTSDVQVLMMVPQIELPTTPNVNINMRRLAAASDNTQVAVRIGVRQRNEKDLVATSTASAAENLTQSLGGQVTEAAMSYDVAPTPTTTTTEVEKVSRSNHGCTLGLSSLVLICLVMSPFFLSCV